jgi:ubiquinone/menaquinone biosynthesis C-methylase UbiE
MSDNPKDLSRQRYTEHAQGYVTSQTHAKGSELDRLVEIAQPQKNWLMLDVATGGGHTTLKFAPLVSRVVATDLTPKMLEVAAQFIREQGVTNAEFKVAEAENLPFEANTFDLLTCRIAAHHFPDAAGFVREAARVVKVGGLVLVQDHVLPDDSEAALAVDGFERHRDPSHNRAFNQAEWEGMFRSAGLRIEHVEQVIKRHGFLDWAVRQGCSPQTITELVEMMRNAPPLAIEWMQPQDWGTESATFCNRHILIAGRKG